MILAPDMRRNRASLVTQMVKNPPAMWETWVRSLGWEEGNSYPLQYSGLENSVNCISHGISKSWTWLSDFHFIRRNMCLISHCNKLIQRGMPIRWGGSKSYGKTRRTYQCKCQPSSQYPEGNIGGIRKCLFCGFLFILYFMGNGTSWTFVFRITNLENLSLPSQPP